MTSLWTLNRKPLKEMSKLEELPAVAHRAGAQAGSGWVWGFRTFFLQFLRWLCACLFGSSIRIEARHVTKKRGLNNQRVLGGEYDQTRINYSQEPPKLYRQLFRPLKLSFEDSRLGIAILGCGLLVPGQVDLHLRFWSSTKFNRKLCFCSTAPGPLQSEIRDGSEACWQKSHIVGALTIGIGFWGYYVIYPPKIDR